MAMHKNRNKWSLHLRRIILRMRTKMRAITTRLKAHISRMFTPKTVLRFKKGLAKINRNGLKVALVIGVVIGIVTLNYLVQKPNNESATQLNPVAETSKAGSLTSGTPDFKTVLPTGKTIEDLGGWTRVSPPDRNAVFAYLDTIGTSPINVSQQPLPDDFRSDTSEQIALLAQGYQANKKLTVGSTDIYIGTSVKGPQSVILTKNNLLILIKSSTPVDDAQWREYINSLD